MFRAILFMEAHRILKPHGQPGHAINCLSPECVTATNSVCGPGRVRTSRRRLQCLAGSHDHRSVASAARSTVSGRFNQSLSRQMGVQNSAQSARIQL